MSDITSEEKKAIASHLRFAVNGYANVIDAIHRHVMPEFPSNSGNVATKARMTLDSLCDSLCHAIDECNNLANKLEAHDE